MLSRLNLRWLIINLLALGLLIVGLNLWQQQVKQTTEPAREDLKPDHFMVNGTHFQYDEFGRLYSQISGQRFEHLNEYAATDITSPRFQLYRPNQPAWFGRADQATVIDSGAQMMLDGNTFITNGPDPENPLSLETESLRILPNQGLALTSDKATIRGSRSNMTSTGLKMDMDNQTLALLNQVRGHIQPGK